MVAQLVDGHVEMISAHVVEVDVDTVGLTVAREVTASPYLGSGLAQATVVAGCDVDAAA